METESNHMEGSVIERKPKQAQEVDKKVETKGEKEPRLDSEGVNQAKLERWTQKAFMTATDSVKKGFLEMAGVEKDGRSEQTRLKAKSLKEKASSTMRSFYQNLRRVGIPATLLLTQEYVTSAALNRKEVETYSDTDHLKRDQLSPELTFVDAFLTPDLVDTYNQCVDFLHTRNPDGSMSKEEIDFKENLVARMVPFGYGMPVVDDLWRLYQMKHGTKHFTKENLQSARENDASDINSEGGGIKSAFDRGVRKINGKDIRIDMLRKYLGLDQYFGSMKPAKYKPTKGENIGGEYVEFDVQDILKALQDQTQNSNIDSQSEGVMLERFEGKDFSSLEEFVKKHQKLPKNIYTNQLGQYKAYIGFDKDRNEKYVSYYDLWDMNPPSWTH